MVAVAAAALGICCGLPLLVSFGVLGLLAGLSSGTWALVVVGAIAVLLGGRRVLGRGRRACLEPSTCQPDRVHRSAAGTTPARPARPEER